MKNTVPALALAVTAAYLFVSAPPPLPEESAPRAAEASDIPARILLDAANLVNAAARTIYTQRIVGPGQEAGLAFGEDWLSPESQAGPLPALFLRAVAQRLRDRGSPLGLFLGSDRPINPSNGFRGEQLAQFAALKADRRPRYFAVSGTGVQGSGIQVALYADVAAAAGCVSCHNAHPKSPKTDWRIGDVMGAATWTFPRPVVSDRELRTAVAAVYRAVEETYSAYLDKVRRSRDPPVVGAAWPGRGSRRLPDAGTFMAAVKAATASSILETAVLAP